MATLLPPLLRGAFSIHTPIAPTVQWLIVLVDSRCQAIAWMLACRNITYNIGIHHTSALKCGTDAKHCYSTAAGRLSRTLAACQCSCIFCQQWCSHDGDVFDFINIRQAPLNRPKNSVNSAHVDACCRKPKLDEKDSIIAFSSAPHWPNSAPHLAPCLHRKQRQSVHIRSDTGHCHDKQTASAQQRPALELWQLQWGVSTWSAR